MEQLLPLGGQLQDYFLIGKKTDDRLFERTDMFLWYGIRGQVEKLSANLSTLRAHGVSLCRKGNGGLAGEHLQRFLREVTAAYRKSLTKQKA